MNFSTLAIFSLLTRQPWSDAARWSWPWSSSCTATYIVCSFFSFMISDSCQAASKPPWARVLTQHQHQIIASGQKPWIHLWCCLAITKYIATGPGMSNVSTGRTMVHFCTSGVNCPKLGIGKCRNTLFPGSGICRTSQGNNEWAKGFSYM